jgi:hypothetical protein
VSPGRVRALRQPRRQHASLARVREVSRGGCAPPGGTIRPRASDPPRREVGTADRLCRWSGACAGKALTCAVTLDTAKTVKATFSKKKIGVKVGVRGAGFVTSRPVGIICGVGGRKKCSVLFVPGTVTLTAHATAGLRFVRWSGACHGSKPTCAAAPKTKGVAATAVFAKK